MDTLKEAAGRFLAGRTIAVAGVSRDGAQAANVIYRRLREAGYRVMAVNPSATTVEGDPCWASVAELPGMVDGVLVATPPHATADVVRDAIASGVDRVWVHRSFGTGSASPEAGDLAREAGITLIDGGCPMMFLEPVDVAHRCMRWVLGVTGRLPDPSEPTGLRRGGETGPARPPR